jgi:hypothetical protein
MTITLPGYYNRFDADDNYDEILFRAGKGLQSAELNEIQSTQLERLKRIADVLFKDGAVMRDAEIAVNASTGLVNLGDGAVYIQGAVREVADASFTISTSGLVQIGVRLVVAEITEQEDATLRDPAVGTRNYQEPGAGRKRVTTTWGWSGDGGDGDFYAVYTVNNGVILNQSAPPEIDGVKQLIARYDREANGNYVVRGLDVVSLGKNTALTNYLFSVLHGVGNLQGFKLDVGTSLTFEQPINPDLQQISNEPQASSSSGTQTVTLNRKPLESILDVVVTKEKTVTLTRGAVAGTFDALPDTAVLSIQSVTQTPTTYVATTDYVLTADTISWAPGGAEPAPGTTYSITYRYLISITPAAVNLDAGTFEVTGAVSGSLILVDYRWKVPRVDTLVLRSDNTLAALKGIPARFNPSAPQASEQELALATISYDWFAASVPETDDTSTRVVDMAEQGAVRRSIGELYQIVAEQRMLIDISSKDPSSKYGIFTDNFFDDDQRDAGITQDAVIAGNELHIPATATLVSQPTNNSDFQLLPYTEQVLIEQLLITDLMKINPYQTFTPFPAKVALNPAVDQWTETVSSTVNVINYFWYPWLWYGRWNPWYYYNWGWYGRYGYGYWNPRVTTTLTSRTETQIPYLRSRSVAFTVEGFGAGEVLAELKFDGRVIAQSLTANSSGVISSSFTVPSGIPAGRKLVEFTGAGGTYGSAVYYGQGALVTEKYVQTLYRCWWAFDPLAQTFTLTEGRYITSIDLKFAVRGSTANDVIVQIRETDNGVPTRTVLADGLIRGADISTNSATFTRCTFGTPVYLEPNTEYAFVVLTDDADHALRVGKLGGFDAAAQKWVTAQPYTVGVLLSSSNASTWTPHQDMDLCFKINGAQFTNAIRTVDMGTITVTNASNLAALVPNNVPSGAEVLVRYTKPGGEVLELPAGVPVPLDAAYTGTLAVQLQLKGSGVVSPIVFPGVQTTYATTATTGTYVSREFQKASGGTKLKVTYQANLPGSGTVTPTYQNGASYSAMTLLTAVALGDNWVEYTYEATSLSALTATRVKLEMAGAVGSLPRVRQLRAVFV